MYSLNRAQIIGNLTKDPELKYTPNGQAVASFSIATNRSWQNSDGTRQDAVEYHDIVAWGKLGEIVSQILTKGKQAYVEGRLQTRSWEAQDGNKRQKTEIVADNVIALGAKGERDSMPDNISDKPASSDHKNNTNKPTPKSDTPNGEIDIDDIPF